MKIAIPTADGRLCLHFGHCRAFALAEVDPEKGTVSEIEYLTPPEHEPGVLPRWLHEQGVETVLAGGMGRTAQMLLSRQGIEVVVGAPSDEPEDLIRAYLAGSLQAGDNACDH
ncbi:MAG TPA: NifB/NifX family molybdenum-iron cluster-binding protein [bacterium]|mgnify:CR=1 FL=1|nr:NifB/NifX family molybdenum-iron cluster-binding protein [bacterium]HPQ66413.1 NifB/NifX family molybdenum-iron cluster-binding protein [bacterium]